MLDCLFGFAATIDAIDGHRFDALFSVYLGGSSDMSAFLRENSPGALREMAKRPAGLVACDIEPDTHNLRKNFTGKSNMNEEKTNRRANEKARKRKEARDKMLAEKTVEKGLLIVHTGKGKGKSTAAFGLAARALGNDMRVGVVQFVKGAWHSGERRVLEHFGEQIDIRVMGEGFTWETQDRARDIRAAQSAWQAAEEMIAACRGDKPAYDLILLDELNIVLRYDYLPINEVMNTLCARPPMLHIVVTGRNAREEIIDVADLVTEMVAVKHPFREQNVRAQRGIEF